MSDPYASVVGQPRAVAALRAAARAPVHAYLLVGPADVGARGVARAFAAGLLCPSGGCGTCSTCSRVLGERHPDLVVFEREGASISKAQIDEVLRVASRPPSEGDRKVLVLVDLHLVAQQYPRLLKTVEEPPPSTVFVLLAESVPPDLVTVASRCVRVDLAPAPAEAIAAALVREGVAPEEAEAVAAASGGRIERARLLARDTGFAARQALWRGVPARLDGSGATIAVLAEQLLASIETVLDPLRDRQAGEVAALDERIALHGGKASGKRDLDDRHKREQRRARLDELRFGLLALESVYHEAAIGGPGASGHAGPAGRAAAIAAIEAIDAAGESLVRNPNEGLLLQGLLARLTELALT